MTTNHYPLLAAAQAAQATLSPAAWLLLAFVLVAGGIATIYAVRLVARAIAWGEKDDPYHRVLYEDPRSGYWDYEPYSRKSPGEPGYRPPAREPLDPTRRNRPRNGSGRGRGTRKR